MGNLNEKLVGAVEQNRLADVKDLLKLGASPDAQDKVDGWTVLTKACLHGFESIVKVLLENQASVNLPNRIGGTALTYAAMRGHHAIVKILLRTSADIQYKTITGRTAFDWAMNKCYMPIAGDLLMASPNVHGYNVKDLSKLLEWACQANQVAVVKKIVEGRQDINWDATVRGYKDANC
jgi:ankyrin repeat protein